MRWRDVATISRLPHSEGRNGSPAPPDLGAHISMSKASQFELQKTGSFSLPEAPRACAVQTAAPTFSRQARPLLPTFGFVRCCRSTGNVFRFGFLLLGYFKKPKIIPSTKRPSFIERFDFFFPLRGLWDWPRASWAVTAQPALGVGAGRSPHPPENCTRGAHENREWCDPVVTCWGPEAPHGQDLS